MDGTLRALNRFGLGARPGDRDLITEPRGWLRAQLAAGAPLVPAPPLASPAAIARAVRALREAGQDRAARQEARRQLRAISLAESRATLAGRVASERPFVERLVAFWSNHLCVSAAKAQVAPLAGSYEREAIRPHVLGRFDAMVLASAKHPAMLLYLDNAQSIGPRSTGAVKSRGRRAARGLNENYARELLELHTLGVGGGYTQADVQELAGALTGWSVGGAVEAANRRLAGSADGGDVLAFAFRALFHEPGTRTVLGRRYAEDGIAQGERAIRDLCRHPSTARFVATKLVTHFVSDAPPAGAVERVSRVFRDSEGDLRAVAAALVELEEAWLPETRKFRTPQDWLVAVSRALGAEASDQAGVASLRQLRQPLWSPAAPDGFGDSLPQWSDPDSLLNRAELARTIARRAGRALDPRDLLRTIDLAPGDPLHALTADRSIPASERIALAIAGPAFQWR
jgi:uncharacterized protein (DUF1800 family)